MKNVSQTTAATEKAPTRKWRIQREFPAMYAGASKWVAMPLIGAVTLLYITRAASSSGQDVYGLGMTAFGVTAALSAICFTVPSTAEGWAQAQYAAEKFLHSSLLLVQSLMLLYIKQAAVSLTWVHTHPWVAFCIAGSVAGVLGLVSASAAWCWLYGFGAINNSLWKNWESRIIKIRATEAAAFPPQQPPVESHPARP